MEGYLALSGEDSAILLGGYVLKRAAEDRGSPIEISQPRVRPEYEQLALPEVC